MKNIVKFDSQRRLKFPKSLLKLVEMDEGNMDVILCSTDKGLMIQKLEGADLKDCKIIAVLKMDDKGRIIFKQEIVTEETCFEIFVLNEKLYIVPTDISKPKP